MADHVQPQYPVQESDPFHHFVAQEQNGSLTEPNLYYEVHPTEEDEGEVFELNSIVIVTSVTPYQELEPFLQPVTRTEAEEPLTDAEAVGIKLKENSITLATEI